jgi:hypothetical protein
LRVLEDMMGVTSVPPVFSDADFAHIDDEMELREGAPPIQLVDIRP